MIPGTLTESGAGANVDKAAPAQSDKEVISKPVGHSETTARVCNYGVTAALGPAGSCRFAPVSASPGCMGVPLSALASTENCLENGVPERT